MELNLIKNLIPIVILVATVLSVIVVFKFVQNKHNNKNIKQKNLNMLSFKNKNKNTINYKE